MGNNYNSSFYWLPRQYIYTSLLFYNETTVASFILGMERNHTYKKTTKTMKETYIGYSTDNTIRYSATSGGVGSSILKYLFDEGIIQTSITFDYNQKQLEYVPRLIHDYKDYKITGSIYHEIKLVQFIKEHIAEIKGGFACFVLPCQARPIRSILKKAGIPCFLLGLTCSSQQSIDATYYLLKRLNIETKDVNYIQYRGNGWPSGIQIQKKDNTTVHVPNNNSIWTQIFHSRLFILKQCFKCQNTLNIYSDITLADPWLKQYMSNETIGQTLIIAYSLTGNEILKKARHLNYIKLSPFEESLFILSQNNTLKRKSSYKKHPRLMRIFTSYLHFICKYNIIKFNFLFKIHCIIKNKIEYQLTK